MKTVEPKDLVGKHKLSGVDFETEKVKDDYSYSTDAQVMFFVLDGQTYKATEDPSDGYRSTCNAIEIVDDKIKNKFTPHTVVGKMKGDEDYRSNDTLQLIDIETGEVVLEVGTDNNDDYYPTCVMYFNPEGLAANFKNIITENKPVLKTSSTRIEIWYSTRTGGRDFLPVESSVAAAKRVGLVLSKEGFTGIVIDVKYLDDDGKQIEDKVTSYSLSKNKYKKI